MRLPACGSTARCRRRSRPARSPASMAFRHMIDFTNRANKLRLPIVSIPILFEIADQRRTEMAIGLLAGIHGHVAAKRVQRLLRDAQRAPVSHGALGAGAGPPGY